MMKIGVVYPQIELGGDPEAVRRFGLAAEELGVRPPARVRPRARRRHGPRTQALTGPTPKSDPFHDPFVMFAYLAGATSAWRSPPGS